MLPTPAQYLLRFDDLCPTLLPEPWRRLVGMMEQYEIRPILAVVPENHDPLLAAANPDPGFWAQMRSMQAAGASVALHGYRHICNSFGNSLLPLHKRSEFAGVPAETQRLWIRAGVEILRGHGLDPKIWVAPRHGFDRTTLEVLRGEGILILSDGLARRPLLRGGLAWIPQQLWAPVEKTKGVWTICLHSNSASGAQLEDLEGFLRQHANQFTSVDRLLAEFPAASPGVPDLACEFLALRRLKLKNARKRLLRWGK
jgi:predicted deacetylase